MDRHGGQFPFSIFLYHVSQHSAFMNDVLHRRALFQNSNLYPIRELLDQCLIKFEIANHPRWELNLTDEFVVKRFAYVRQDNGWGYFRKLRTPSKPKIRHQQGKSI